MLIKLQEFALIIDISPEKVDVTLWKVEKDLALSIEHILNKICDWCFAKYDYTFNL